MSEEKEDRELLESFADCSEQDLDDYDLALKWIVRFWVLTLAYPFNVLSTNRILNTYI